MVQNNFSWPLINDNITQRDREVLADFCLNGKRFTNGEKVKEFEKVWAEWLGVKHSVMVNSGASGTVYDLNVRYTLNSGVTETRTINIIQR